MKVEVAAVLGWESLIVRMALRGEKSNTERKTCTRSLKRAATSHLSFNTELFDPRAPKILCFAS